MESIFSPLKTLTAKQRNTLIAAYLGWTLDSFDFFILIMVLSDVAKEFHTSLHAVSYAVGLTLMMRPLGALVFGLFADRFGRRPTMMIDVLLYSFVELLSGFAPNLTILIILRAIFGAAMGGEWGVGASLTMETIPEKTRGIVSGLLQTGYPMGYLVASLLYGVAYPFIGWRGMFIVGALPALLALYIRSGVEESPVWKAGEQSPPILPKLLKGLPFYLPFLILMLFVWIFPIFVSRSNGQPFAWEHWIGISGQDLTFWFYALLLIIASIKISGMSNQQLPIFFYVILLMTAFNFFSHGSQDLYPTFLKEQLHYPPAITSLIVIIYNIGAILGGLTVGSLSEKYGRKKCIIWAALLSAPAVLPATLLVGIPGLPGALILIVGTFILQFLSQGAWGIVPVHLNELSPKNIRGTFPGFTYQLGNLFASYNLTIQTTTAQHFNNNLGLSIAISMVLISVVVATVTALGPEAKGVKL
jgi:MFS transporter, SHS family, lactate transporter